MRITVFASASPETPKAYMDVAEEMGILLAEHGDLCVNGGGALGCMGALNRSMKRCGGRVHGVIHEQWVDSGEAAQLDDMTIVGGSDLSERKRLLFAGCDCLIVLPGGCGTVDEMFDAIAGRHTKLSSLPIVVVNTNGFYDGIIAWLNRARDERLLRCEVEGLVHIAATPADALAWARKAVIQGAPCASEVSTVSVSAARRGIFIKGVITGALSAALIGLAVSRRRL
jgi:uncharacterized protein (TIGR00730 family)